MESQPSSPDTPSRNTHHHTTPEINERLNKQRQHPNYNVHPGRQHRQNIQLPYQKSYRRTTHQQTLVSDTSNDHWGDQPQINQDDTKFQLRVISRNVNTLSNAHQALSWQALTQAALDIEADIVCIQETNTNWTTPAITTASKIFNNSTYRASKVAISACKASDDKHYQPGGTLTAALGRWTA